MTRWGFKTLIAIAALFLLPGFVEASGGSPSKIYSWQLPEDISTYGHGIDYLFNTILVITTIVFVITEGLLLYAIIAFRRRPGEKSKHIHGNHKLEIAWTVAPALILIFLALQQTSIWSKAKTGIPEESEAVVVRVFAKQFEWNFSYAGNDGKFDTEDDVFTINHLIIPVDKPIVFHMRSLDVIHSLFIPNLRFKQDLMPGMHIRGWIEAKKTSKLAQMQRNDPKFTYEIACTELCGIGHHTMRSRLEILEQDEFDKWHKEESDWAPDSDVPSVWENWERAYGMQPEKPTHHGADADGSDEHGSDDH